MTLQTGADLGPYTVLGPARRGPRHARSETPLPRVWRAAPVRGGDPVALVTTGPAADGDAPDAVAGALRREWELSGSLRHPHLVATHDLLDGPDGPVLVTAWADAGSVTELLRGPGRFSAGQTVTLLAGLAQALLACHERGLVHGDVSPDTVLVAADGRPMLARVGRGTAAADTGSVWPAEPRCTSPDVARGRTPTAVDDVFAMGATAMQCLLGRPAWPAQDLRDVVIQSEFGQWPTIPPDEGGGPELAELVDAMLAADPARRPAVREVLARLADCPTPEPLTGGQSPPAAGVDRGRHPREDVDPRPQSDAPPGRAWPAALLTGRWSRVVAAAAALVTITVLAVGAGVWWAGADRPENAVLAAAPIIAPASAAPVSAAPVSTTAVSTTAVSTTVVAETAVSATAVGPAVVDWTAVVVALDRQRAAAYAAADASLLSEVYVADTPALIEDRARIGQLAGSGLRVPGLVHEITAVEVVGTTDADITVAVSDALPAAVILDAVGVAVGSTTPTPPTRRLLTLTAVGDGYRIAAVPAP